MREIIEERMRMDKLRIVDLEEGYWKTLQEIQEQLIKIHGLLAGYSKQAQREGAILRELWNRLYTQLDSLNREGITERMLYEKRAARECTGLKNGA